MTERPDLPPSVAAAPGEPTSRPPAERAARPPAPGAFAGLPAGPAVDVRPVRLTRVCRALAVVLVVVFTIVGVTLNVGSAQVFGLADSIAMVVLGLMLAAIVLGFTRARVQADASGLRIRGAMGEKVVPWGVVAAVRLDDGAPWASIDLQDDDTLALFAVQANDGERATEAVLALRRLMRSAHAG